MTSGTIIAPEKAKPGTEEMFPLKITHVHSPRLFGLGSTFFFPRSFDWDCVPLVVSMSLFSFVVAAFFLLSTIARMIGSAAPVCPLAGLVARVGYSSSRPQFGALLSISFTCRFSRWWRSTRQRGGPVHSFKAWQLRLCNSPLLSGSVRCCIAIMNRAVPICANAWLRQ